MKRTLASLIAFAAVMSVAAACSSSKNDTNVPGQQVQPVAGPAWKLRLNSIKAGTNAEVTNSYYGFTVTADGRYEVGPGPQGQLLVRQLSAEELATVQAQLDPQLAQIDALNEETCATNTRSETTDTLTLTRY